MSFDRNPLPQLIPQRVNHLLGRVVGRRWGGRRTLAVQGGPVHEQPVGLKQAKGERYRAVRSGEFFGPPGGGWQQRWFRLELPRAGKAEVGRRVLFWDCDGETTVWWRGQPWAGLDVGHAYCVLPDGAGTVHLDCGTYMTGIWAKPGIRIDPQGCAFRDASLALRDELGWRVSYDLEALVELMRRLIKQAGLSLSSRFGYNAPIEHAPVLLRRLLHDLDGAADAFDRDGLAGLERHLRRIWPRYRGSDLHGRAALCGHAHLDLVWLWPEAETNRKGVHTFATVLRLMERYPEFRFTQSQPAIYEAVGALAPGLLGEIRTRIAQQRWEATGAMEVESDVTLPSGEGLARSLLYGQQRFAELRGGPSTVLWIPDVFGYSNCLPQLCRLAGVESFYTTKLTWSAISRFPHTSFRWRGPDGAEVLTHLCPTGYNGAAHLDEIADPLLDHQQAAIHDDLLLPTGYGDGAGGPNEDMLERSRRFADLAGAPRTAWTRVEDFFAGLQEVAAELPCYEGELYLEYHRGTYTTQGRLKELHRGAEKALLLHEAARVWRGKGGADARAWLRTVFVQFHDAIPGSSIGLVYEQLEPELEAVIERETAAALTLCGGKGAALTVFNPLALPRHVVVPVPAGLGGSGLQTGDGRPVPVQGRGRHRVALVPCAGFGATELLPATVRERLPEVVADPRRLTNGIVDARFDARGRLQGLRVRGAEIGVTGSAFRIYPDHPAAFDAWDIDRGALALASEVADRVELAVHEQGPVRAVLRGSTAIGERSRLQVDWILEAGADDLRVELSVDWQEDHRLLKFHLLTDRRGREAIYGAPFGSVRRQQVPGPASVEAQWEVAGQRWAAVVDDRGTGAALITEAKYGFSCRDGDLGLSLLRAPAYPDPKADRRQHRIAFAIGEHRAQSGAEGLSTAARAETLFGLVATGAGRVASPAVGLELSALGSLVPAAIKPAESGSGFVLRLHETAGIAGTAIVDLDREGRRVRAVDLLERELPLRLPSRGKRVRLPYTPYQILSVLIE